MISRDGVSTLKIAGVIDRDNELVPLEAKLASGPMLLDLGEIERINSCGVRDWVNWLGRIERTALAWVLFRQLLTGDRLADQPRQQLHRERHRQELLRAVLLPALQEKLCGSKRVTW